jgi:hypothetical protein
VDAAGDLHSIGLDKVQATVGAFPYKVLSVTRAADAPTSPTLK